MYLIFSRVLTKFMALLGKKLRMLVSRPEDLMTFQRRQSTQVCKVTKLLLQVMSFLSLLLPVIKMSERLSRFFTYEGSANV